MSATPPDLQGETELLDAAPERELWLWLLVLLALALAGGTAVWLVTRGGGSTTSKPTAVVPPARTVTVKVTTDTPAPALPTVPNLVGADEKTAKRQLHDAGFDVKVEHQPTDDPAQNKIVLSEQPGAGTPVAAQATVTLFVGKLSHGRKEHDSD